MRVAVVQFSATTDVARNLAAIERLTAERALVGCGLVVLPEATMHDFGPPDLPLGQVAQDLDGPFVEKLSRLARSLSTTTVAGMFERSGDPERPFNTLVAMGPDGGLRASYRKIHLFDSFGYRESERLSPGEPAPVVLPIAGMTAGLMTCYDLRFPELGRLLTDTGADVLVVPAAWVRGEHKVEQWSTLLRARAIENTAYVVAAAQCGRTYAGHSLVADPMGLVVSELADEEGSAVVELDPKRVDQVRRTNPSLQNRRLRVVP